MSRDILKASAFISMVLFSCLMLNPSVSSISRTILGLNLCSFLAEKVISMTSSLQGFIYPLVFETRNSSGNPSTPLSFHFTGIEHTFLRVRVFVSFLSKRSLSNSTMSWSTSTTGFAPWHCTGKMTGLGLSFSKQMTSSL